MSAGVLTTGALLLPDGSTMRSAKKPTHIGKLAEHAVAANLDTVMVHETGRAWLGLPASIPDAGKAHRFMEQAPGPLAPLRWYNARKLAGGHVAVVFVGYGKGLVGPWEAEGPAQLAAALAAFGRALGWGWRGSPGLTAESLIAATHPAAHGGRLLTRVSLPDEVADNGLEKPYRWARPWTRREWDRAKWIHTYDQNAQYLAAWQVAELGVGEPYRRHGKNLGMVDTAAVGAWRLDGNPDPSQPFIPYRYERPAPDLSTADWRMSPTLARWRELGATLSPSEAWLWPERTRYLRHAAERLRDARAALSGTSSPAAELALAAVKQCYTRETGRLGMTGRDASRWYRPDWSNTIRATARVNLHRRLSKLTAAPFAILTDGLAFAAPTPDPLDYARYLGLPLGDGVGRFRHTGSAPSDGIRAMYRAAHGVPPDPADILAAVTAERAA
jgi:hypothetical protein